MPDGSPAIAPLAASSDLPLDAAGYLQRCEDAFAERRPFEAVWERQRVLMLPDSQPFLSQFQSQGARDRETTVDTYAQFCARVHAAFLYGALINGESDSIKLVPMGRKVEITPDVARWLDEYRDALMEIALAPSTGLADQAMAMLLERTVHGNGILYGGDRPGKNPIARCAPLRDCAFLENDDFEADEFWWKQSLAAYRWVEKFGKAAVGESVARMVDSKTGRRERLTFIHGVMPNPEWNPHDGRNPRRRRYLSVWLNEKDALLVSRNWLTSNCYTAFRDARRANEVYGRGKGDEALEEAAMAQRVRIGVIRAIEKTVDPLMLLPDDGVMTPPTNEPEGAMVVRADLMARQGDPIRYLQSNARPDMGQEFLQTAVYGAMDRAFARDVMQLPREPRMLDSQLIGLQEEQSRAVVPLVAPLFAPMARFLGRIADIAQRQGRLPRPPAAAANLAIGVEFRNPLERAARLAEVRAFQQALGLLATGAQVDPGARHSLKIVEGLTWCYGVLGVPQRFIPTQKEIDAAMQAAANVQREALQREQALDGSTVLKNLGAGARGLGGMGGDGERAAA